MKKKYFVLPLLVGAMALAMATIVPSPAEAQRACAAMKPDCEWACSYKKSKEHCEKVCDARLKKAEKTGIWPMNSGARLPCARK